MAVTKMEKIVANLEQEEASNTENQETIDQEQDMPGAEVDNNIDAQAPQDNQAYVDNQQYDEQNVQQNVQQDEQVYESNPSLDYVEIQQDQVDLARELAQEWYSPEEIQYAQQIYLQELQRQYAEAQAQQEQSNPVQHANRDEQLREITKSINEPVRVSESKDEPLTQGEQENYKKLYESELEKRIAIQWEKSELEAMVKYQQNMLDKQGDKQLNIIDKQKEMEVELRRAQAAQTPEEIIPLSQSYQIYQENKTPIHKYRLINQALDLVQKVTWVSAEDYLQQIFLTENKDIPNIEWVAPTAKVPEPEKKLPISF